MAKKTTHIRLHSLFCADLTNFEDLQPGDYAVDELNESYPGLVNHLLHYNIAEAIPAAAARLKNDPTLNLWQRFAYDAANEQGDDFEDNIRWIASRNGQYKMSLAVFKKRLQAMTFGALPPDIIVMFKDNAWFEYDLDPDNPNDGYWTLRHTPYEPTQKAKDWQW